MGELRLSRCRTISPLNRIWKRSCPQQVSCCLLCRGFISCTLEFEILKSFIENVKSSSESQHSHESEGQDSDLNHEPIQERYGNPSNSRFRRIASKTVVTFGPNDPQNPVNWRNVCLRVSTIRAPSRESSTNTFNREESFSSLHLVSCRS